MNIVPHEDKEVRRNRILDLEDAIKELPQAELETIHHFAPGVYARELRIPKGVLLTGKIHKTEHLNILAAGKIAVANAAEGEAKLLEAPMVYVSKPGTKRAGYALEDAVWITIHVTESTDLEEIEHEVIAESFDALEHDSAELLEFKS